MKSIKINVLNVNIGIHGRKYNTFYESVKVVKDAGILACQYYIGGRISWKTFDKIPALREDDIEKTKELCDKTDMECFAHSCLLHNLNGSTHIDCFDEYLKKCKSDIQRKKLEDERKKLPFNKRATKEGLSYELDVCVALGFRGVVVHIGSGAIKDKALSRISETIEEVLNLETPLTKDIADSMKISVDEVKKRRRLLLENAAGEGSKIGSNIEEINIIINGVEESLREQVGVCIDTCHLYAAGDYDIASADEMKRFIKDFDTLLGLEKLWLIHLNDSVKGFGSHLDRHETLTKGKIWSDSTDSLKELVKMCSDRNIPMVLETPSSKRLNDSEIKLVRKLAE